jgi:hypothetical protein
MGQNQSQMQGQMQAMRDMMARIHAEQDPAERERLMQQHMQSMHSGMAMMGQMMRGSGPGEDGGARPCAEGDTRCEMDRLQMGQGAMNERMGMMQQMMTQMMEHMMEHMAMRQESAPSARGPQNSPRRGAPNAQPAPAPAPAPNAENHAQHH